MEVDEFFAHTDPAHPDSAEAIRYWEPLFTPLGEGVAKCSEIDCKRCENLEPRPAIPFQVYDSEWQFMKTVLSFHCDDTYAILDHRDSTTPASSAPAPSVIPTPSTCEPRIFHLPFAPVCD